MLRRPLLLEKIVALLEEGHLFINAPAGYGKTMLLQSLQTERPLTHLIALTPADSDLAVLAARLEALRQPENTLLLDDVHHLLTADGAIQWLQQQMRQPRPRWILAGRQPLFAATDLALYGRIHQLNMADLAFTEREARILLGDGRPELDAWRQRLEGWPLGLGLLKNLGALANPQPIAEQQLFAYLTEQLLDALPAELRRFMLVTAVPLTFNVPLAAHLLPASDPTAAIQILLTRNLFLYQDEPDGTYRYPDLVRTFLRQQLPSAERDALVITVIAWLQAGGQLSAAIEHALEAGLATQAADLLALPEAFAAMRAHGHFLTHHRWFTALPPALAAERPLLWLRNGAALFHLHARRREAWAYLEHGVALAKQHDHMDVYRLGLRYMAFVHGDEGRLRQALALYQQLIARPDLEVPQYIAALQDMIGLHASLAQFDLAHYRYRQLQERQATGETTGTIIAEINLASQVLTVQGRWAEAHALLTDALRKAEARNNLQDAVFVRRNLGHLRMEQGNWAGQRENLVSLDALLSRLELLDERIDWILQHDRSLLAVAEGRFAEAAALLRGRSQAADAIDSPQLRLLYATARVWLARRQGDYEIAIQGADAALTDATEFPYLQGRLALERDLAVLLASLPDGDLRGFRFTPQSRALIPMRARAELVRLRMALALVCWRLGHPRWRRLAQRVLAEGQRPYFSHLLTTRDPELAAEFWKMLLVEALAPERAIAALRTIGQSGPLFPLLHHANAVIRHRTAEVLMQLGDEQAMPTLTTAIAAETDNAVKKTLERALETLEALPPPPLQIRLLGDFSLQRGEQHYRTDAFPRPIVARLLQYFVLYAGKPIPRDQILEALWPEGDPEKAAGILRTLNSHLRTVLDPYMRPRGPNRYIVAERNNYYFDPYGVVASDLSSFTREVAQALALGALDPTELASLERTLTAYAPLLPDLPYADWLIEPRQRLDDLYLEGCLCLAEGYLTQRAWHPSELWLRRALRAAPWLEQAWQLLIRLYARQGQRARALQAYHEATAALHQELGVGLSALTHWLYERVERGEAI
ncbi:BTAD domain-containing putative transcriptional regulator [Candidatus Chloroploca asiatica]|uniref:BTAD domain-containing putative transcriptional regulator n=1 Tax=Candidatus Chloroploca asiatica TaxID=1506545 RepID=UPI001FE53CF6|nr:BTAD domain-containing putative transcriptional regulator [Candidatus Chloroploca asiatica]